jgi:hypothetical protein
MSYISCRGKIYLDTEDFLKLRAIEYGFDVSQDELVSL